VWGNRLSKRDGEGRKRLSNTRVQRGAPGPSSPTSGCHRTDIRTHTQVGHRELAREWRAEMVTASGSKQASRGGADFSDEICLRLVREIVKLKSLAST
jgi:hypothetical protein